MEYELRKRKIVNKKISILIILTIILGVGVSLAATYFAYAYQDSRENKLATAQLTIDYTDGNAINLTSDVPMIDDLGIENPGYELQLKVLTHYQLI